MNTYHVSTFCKLKDDHPFTDNVMVTFEVVFVLNSHVPPSEQTIGGILHITAPNLVPLVSEVTEIPFIANLNGRG